MYVQVDGVAMGSPLGVLFANFYMGSLEEKIFTQHPDLKPPLYARYIDDIFINASSEEHVTQLIDIFKNNSALNFTHEIEEDQQLPFLFSFFLLMDFGNLLNSVNQNLRSLIRWIEKTSYKLQ